MRDKRRLEFGQIYIDLKGASKLLKDRHLIWSTDFEAIRYPLARLLDTHASLGTSADANLIEIARILIDEDTNSTL